MSRARELPAIPGQNHLAALFPHRARSVVLAMRTRVLYGGCAAPQREAVSGILGRAESDYKATALLLEDNVEDPMPWLLGKDVCGPCAAEARHCAHDDRKVGLLAGPRGSGKTFWLRRVNEEYPIELWVLDKETLQYQRLTPGAPGAPIVVDDVHYYIQALELRHLDGKPVLSEADAIATLEAFRERAEAEGRRVLYVSDEGPSGLAYLFRDEALAHRLVLLLPCIILSDDRGFLARHGIHEAAGAGAYFRGKLSPAAVKRLRKALGVTDIPLVDRLNPVIAYPNEEVHVWNDHGILRLLDEELRKLPVGTYEQSGEVSRTRRWLDRTVEYVDTLPVLIGSLRDLFIAKAVLGKLNRATLHLEGKPSGDYNSGFEAWWREGGFMYDGAAVKACSFQLHKVVFGAVHRQHMTVLARALLLSRGDTDDRRAFLTYEIAKE